MFRPVVERAQGLSVFFDLDSKHLWYGSFDGQPALAHIDLESGQRTTIALPSIGRDGVAYIAQNPARRTEYAIATFARSIYRMQDGGKTWKSIAERGEGP